MQIREIWLLESTSSVRALVERIWNLSTDSYLRLEMTIRVRSHEVMRDKRIRACVLRIPIPELGACGGPRTSGNTSKQMTHDSNNTSPRTPRSFRLFDHLQIGTAANVGELNSATRALPSAGFDILTFTNTGDGANQIGRETLSSLLRDARRLLKIDGVLILEFENPFGIERQGTAITNGIGPRVAAAVLREHGFSALRFSFVYPNIEHGSVLLTERAIRSGENGAPAFLAKALEQHGGAVIRLVPPLWENGLLGELAGGYLVLATTSESILSSIEESSLLGVSYDLSGEQRSELHSVDGALVTKTLAALRAPLETLDQVFRAAILRDDSALASKLLTEYLTLLESGGAFVASEGSPSEMDVFPEWRDALPTRIAVSDDGLVRLPSAPIANPPRTASTLLSAAIDELLPSGVPELAATRTMVIEALTAAGYLSAKGTTTSSSSPSIPATSSPILRRLDELATSGQVVEALKELESQYTEIHFLPGVNLRAAEWNLQLGRTDKAIKAAIQELKTRPDNERALQIVLTDLELLNSILAGEPSHEIAVVAMILESHLQQGRAR